MARLVLKRKKTFTKKLWWQDIRIWKGSWNQKSRNHQKNTFLYFYPRIRSKEVKRIRWNKFEATGFNWKEKKRNINVGLNYPNAKEDDILIWSYDYLTITVFPAIDFLSGQEF